MLLVFLTCVYHDARLRECKVRYRYSLRPGRSGDRIPVETRVFAPVDRPCGTLRLL